MKTILLSILISFFGLISYAQNWELVNANRTVFFQHSDSTHITNTIVIDSSEINGSNTSYYSGYAFKYCDTCANFSYEFPIIYRYAKEFIGHTITNDITNNQYNLDGNIIKQNSLLNDSWNFNASLTATTISKSEQSILGVLDSVKVIELSNSDTIIISKNHGIVRYPDFSNLGKHLELVGYHQGQNSYGEYLPNFWRTYDFNVGDVFYYSIGQSVVAPPVIYKSSRVIFTILNTIPDNDSIKYKVKIHGYSSGEYNSLFIIDTIDTLSIPYKVLGNESIFGCTNIKSFGLTGIGGINSNIYNNSFYKYFLHNNLYLEDNMNGNPNPSIQISSPIYSSSFGNGKKVLYVHHLTDSLYSYNLDDNLGRAKIEYYNNFGRVIQETEYFESGYTETMTGAIINGDTIGNIFEIADDLGFTENNLQNELSFYPNPATHQITITNGIKSLKIFSNVGQLVIDITQPTQIIDVSKLPKGIYFIFASDLDDNVLASKLIIE